MQLIKVCPIIRQIVCIRRFYRRNFYENVEKVISLGLIIAVLLCALCALAKKANASAAVSDILEGEKKFFQKA